MEFTDRILICEDCGAEFVFTAGEQVFFNDKQFKNDPKRCKQCKAKRSSGTQGESGDAHHLFRMWRGDNRSLQAHAEQACALPFLLPEKSEDA